MNSHQEVDEVVGAVEVEVDLPGMTGIVEMTGIGTEVVIEIITAEGGDEGGVEALVIVLTTEAAATSALTQDLQEIMHPPRCRISNRNRIIMAHQTRDHLEPHPLRMIDSSKRVRSNSFWRH